VTGDRWEPRVERFVDSHYASIRGQVRLRNARRQLEMFVPDGPLQIVDVGGGAGTMSSVTEDLHVGRGSPAGSASHITDGG